MARRLKSVTPVWEDVDDGEEDTVWVGLKVDKADKGFTVDLKPYIRSAEVMINPNIADDYHVKMPVAKKIVAALGDGWTIEGGQIVRAMAFKTEYLYTSPTKDVTIPLFGEIRRHLAALPKEVLDTFKGVCLFNEGARPFEMKRQWLYVGIPTASSCAKGRISGVTPDTFSIEGAQHLPNGIQYQGCDHDMAIYAPQTIYLKAFSANYQALAQLVSFAIHAGAKVAMEYTGGNIAINKWLESAADQLKARRGDDIAAVEKEIKKRDDAMRAAVIQIKKEKEAAEEAQVKLAGLKEKVTPENILRMYPALTNVDYINRDDPTMTVVVTKDITINGVNLGPYFISMRPETAELVITGKGKPENTPHPNLYKDGKDWKWMIGEASELKILENLAGGRLGEATNTIIENLLSLYENSEAYAKRLSDIKEFQEKPEPIKVKRGRPKKEAPKVIVAEGIEGDPIKV